MRKGESSPVSAVESPFCLHWRLFHFLDPFLEVKTIWVKSNFFFKYFIYVSVNLNKMPSVGCGQLGILFLADYFLLRLSFFLLLDHLLTLSAIKTTLVLQNDFATATGPAGETSNAVFQGNRENGMYFLCQLDFKLVNHISFIRLYPGIQSSFVDNPRGVPRLSANLIWLVSMLLEWQGETLEGKHKIPKYQMYTYVGHTNVHLSPHG